MEKDISKEMTAIIRVLIYGTPAEPLQNTADTVQLITMSPGTKDREKLCFHEELQEGGHPIPYALTILLEPPLADDIRFLKPRVPAYTLFYTDMQMNKDSTVQEFLSVKMAEFLPPSEVHSFLEEAPEIYHTRNYGAKLKLGEAMPAEGSDTLSVTVRGNDEIHYKGVFGLTYTPILTYLYNIVLKKDTEIELFQEYDCSENASLVLSVHETFSGNTQAEGEVYDFPLKDHPIIRFRGHFPESILYICILAKGYGEASLGSCHYRDSHRGKYLFLPGGKRLCSGRGEETFWYFNPGDRKPPLGIYFSGYRTREGFEGLHMMSSLSCPFLLFQDPRIEGGCFYMGSPDYENNIVSVIRKAADFLHFIDEETVFSGISMGSTGALYYATFFHPSAVLLGKPLINIGNIALNERFIRYGGFPTSLDTVMHLTGKADPEHARLLNRKMWDRIDSAHFEGTDFAISYMKDDDYDPTAYPDFLHHMAGQDIKIYGKGNPGRHNDNTTAIVNWFMARFQHILKENFGRS